MSRPSYKELLSDEYAFREQELRLIRNAVNGKATFNTHEPFSEGEFLANEIMQMHARIAELEAENTELKERVAMLDVTAVFKSLGEMGHIEKVANLKAELDRATARIAELEASQGWRVVADGELPELGKEVIFYDSIIERRLKGCLRKNGGVEWLSDEGYTFSSRDDRYSWITHWMPLPTPPEVQE